MAYNLNMTSMIPPATARAHGRPEADFVGLVFRLIRFGFVGGMATATHACVAVASLKLLLFHPVAANFAGFVTAFSISLIGHSVFTFRTPMTTRRALKFTLVAVSGVCMSSAFVLAADMYSGLSRTLILALAAVATPLFTFITHSLWTFRHGAEQKVL